MARSVYVTSPEGLTGKSMVALGLADLFTGQVERVGVFRPVPHDEPDHVLALLCGRVGQPDDASARGVTYEQAHHDPDAALATIVERYRALERDADVVIVVGSDFEESGWPSELAFNARVAANIGAPVLLTVDANGRDAQTVARVVDVARHDIAEQDARTVAVVVKGASEDLRLDLDVPVWVLRDLPLLESPTLRTVMAAVGGELVAGDEALLVREMEHLLVAGMTPEHCLDHLREGQVVVTPGDRPELLITMLTAHKAQGFPSLTGILLNGGYRPSGQVMKLLDGIGVSTPVIATDLDTYRTAREAAKTVGHTRIDTPRKVEQSLATFHRGVDGPALLDALDVPRSDVVTPLMFQSELMERARSQRRRIVLPEPDDDRVLQAASRVLAADVADVVLLGDEATVRARAKELGVDIEAATIVSPRDETYLERYAREYQRLREKKGMTMSLARDTLQDVSYFGTMMVHLGDADGMVSGAAHTTAHTIVPSFQIVKTKPGTSIVSSVFLMCLRDRVLVYGDCAVNPDPTAEQLADIAISSAATAAAFDIEPRVAMLSYSTGESGSGADVDKVREATRLARERRPDLSIEGPIQYDAAVDTAVASKKLPGSDVAGRATVFVFPDLNTGNNTYKAVQRSAHALAIGPVLQGLNKPVNDLSRGALVDDIVNTIAITAIQAQASTPPNEHAQASAQTSTQDHTVSTGDPS